MKRTYLVRHGTPACVAGRCIGQYDVPLSPKGYAEMEKLADLFSAAPNRILSSDLVRAVESANVLSMALNIPVIIDPRLREISFGEWDGRTWEEIHASDAEALARWSADWVNSSPPGGESMSEVAGRVRDWLNDPNTAMSNGVDECSTTIVVSHAGVIRASRCLVSGLPLQRAFEIEVEYGRVAATLLSAKPGTMQVTPGIHDPGGGARARASNLKPPINLSTA